jgi:hypothetical protein
MLAAEGGDLSDLHRSGVQALVAQGAAVNLQDEEGSSALQLAAENRHDDIVQFLIDHNAGVNLRNKLSSTPLMQVHGGVPCKLFGILSPEAHSSTEGISGERCNCCWQRQEIASKLSSTLLVSERV